MMSEVQEKLTVNLVEESAVLLDVPNQATGIEMLRKIEACGRVSHASEDQASPDSWKRFIEAVVLQHGDWSIVEHVSVTVNFILDRGCCFELVRHRLCAFTQASTRFVNLTKTSTPPQFVLPDEISNEQRPVWDKAIGAALQAYCDLVAAGAKPQIARSVLPNALAAKIVVTTNLRNWRHMFLMRTTREAHPQLRRVMNSLLVQFKERIPLLYDDIEADGRQIENLRKPR
ncbi:MAG: FAD-dependent thymidylate synthase [Patescibacteria group bacterium]|nr:FAD-dependent thymidylate synthase [Patescibacteria group bacterium]